MMNGAMPSGNHHFGHGNSQRLGPRLHLHSGEIGAQTKRVSVLIGNRQPSYYGSRANNTTLGLRIGSIIFGKSPTNQPVTNLSEYLAKQVPCQSDSYSKQEPNVRTLWPDFKMMVSSMKLTVPHAAPQQLSRSANTDHLKTGRSESNLRFCGECWPNSSNFSSLVEMTGVHLSSQRSTPAHKFSALRMEETALENQCSILPHLEVDKYLLLLHLICLFLVFRLRCCNGFSLKPTGLMCDGRPFASPLFRRLAGRGPFTAVSCSDGFHTLRYL